MKTRRALTSFAIAALLATALAADDFSQRLTPEEFARAGLGKLSAEEVAQLDALFKKYATAPAAKPAAAKVVVQPGTKVEVAALETQIDGDFDGWEEQTTWRMADGTRWQVDNKPAPYIAKKRLSHPRVRISPGAISGYWLEIVDLNVKVRVRQVK